MQFTTASLISGFAAIAYALTAPASGDPSGNPIIHPGLNELIPAGTTYAITWTPTTQGSISLVLLRGPSTNVVPLMTIADTIENTGSYNWDVPSTLEPDTTHYGIQLIVEGTGQYQYSPQCGVSNGAASSGSVSANASTTSTVVSATESSGSWSSYPSTVNGTGAANYSIPVLTPTGSTTVPTSLMTMSSSSSEVVLSNSVVPSATQTFQATPTGSSAVSTGAAVANVARNVGAVVMAGVVAALAL